MKSRIEHDQPALPGNHGQFGGEIATEAFTTMRATQRVTVKPVVPRRSPATRPKPSKGRQDGSA